MDCGAMVVRYGRNGLPRYLVDLDWLDANAERIAVNPAGNPVQIYAADIKRLVSALRPIRNSVL